MDPASLQQLVPLLNRRFQSFAEATDAALGVLAGALPGSIVVGQLDRESNLCRVLDTRGTPAAGLERGAMLPFGAPAAANGDGASAGSTALSFSSGSDHLDPVFLVSLGFSESISLPVELSDGQVVGVVCALSTEEGAYGSDHVVLLGLAARLLSYEWERVRSRAELRELRQRLRDGSATDAETGLPNRAGFGDLLEREWKLARRGTVPSTVVACEVRIAGLNGDPDPALARLAIRDAADVLAAAARGTDHVGRIGEMTLGVVMIGCDEPAGVAALIHRFEHALARTTAGRPFEISLTSGAHALAEADSAELALELADRATRESAANGAAAAAAAADEAGP